MVVCKNCGNETEAAKYCGFCGQPLSETIIESNKTQQETYIQQHYNRIPKHDNYTIQQGTYQDNQQSTYQNTNYQGNYQQQQYNQQSSYEYNYNYQQQNPSYNQKSQFLGIFLSIIFPGLGHIYVGKVAEGIVLMAACFLMLIFAFLIVPALITFAIWIYAIIKTNNMIEKYNRGLPY